MQISARKFISLKAHEIAANKKAWKNPCLNRTILFGRIYMPTRKARATITATYPSTIPIATKVSWISTE
jgi:hypothetical protein